MKRKNVRKKKSRKAKSTRKKIRLPKNLPKILAEKVEAVAETPEDVSIQHPTSNDPVVLVKGSLVGAWANL